MPTEDLREALLELDEARQRESEQRRIAEALLDGLRVLVTTADPEQLFPSLFEVMAPHMGFESASVLLLDDEGVLVADATSYPLYAGTEWRQDALFRRVLEGETVAVFDTRDVPEWTSQPQAVQDATRSALLFPIHAAGRHAMVVCTHSQRAHFGRSHIDLARRFSVLAIQALQRLESDARVAALEAQLEAEIQLADLSAKLAESERELARARKMEALGLLAGGVAHDLNNILSGLVTLPELLLMNPSLDDEGRWAAGSIGEAGQRAAAVVADLLTVARGVASPRTPVDLNESVVQYLHSPEHLESLDANPSIQVDSDLADDLPTISASAVHVGKVLMNLVSNAADALGPAGGRILIRTRHRRLDEPVKGYTEVRHGEYAVLSVSDDGPGIGDMDLDRIFEPFYTTKALGRSGTGLGLTIVWSTVEDHGGYVDVTTDAGGTAFDLYLPIAVEAETEQPPHVSAGEYRGRGEHILVVDDEDSQRRIAEALLRKLGYTVAVAASGEEALEYAAARPVDLVLLDMVMGHGLDGRQTYEKLIEIRPGQKAVIASGYSFTEDVRQAQELGAGAYVSKPYTVEALGLAVRQELDSPG